jgi:c-di-GMP-binding flagellar brake protein YcgR
LEANARRAMDDKDVPENMRGLLSVLRWLDFKLDLILDQLRSRERQAAFPHHLETIDISGAGIGMIDCGQLKLGERIIMAFNLPDSPSQPIYSVGEVVRVAEDPSCDGQARAAVRFEEIAESDRERIIRFTFNQQRRLISQRKGGEEV